LFTSKYATWIVHVDKYKSTWVLFVIHKSQNEVHRKTHPIIGHISTEVCRKRNIQGLDFPFSPEYIQTFSVPNRFQKSHLHAQIKGLSVTGKSIIPVRVVYTPCIFAPLRHLYRCICWHFASWKYQMYISQHGIIALGFRFGQIFPF
jgi:hypothetical protein